MFHTTIKYHINWYNIILRPYCFFIELLFLNEMLLELRAVPPITSWQRWLLNIRGHRAHKSIYYQ